MAKPAAPVPATEPAPSVPVQAHTRAAPGSVTPTPPAAGKVILWDNDAQGERMDAPADEGAAKPAELPGTPPAKVDNKPTDDKTKDPAAKDEPGKPTPAERRAATFDRLGAERRHRELETALKAEQGTRAAKEAELAKLLKTAKEGTLGELLALRGIPADDALELLLKKDPSLEGAPAAGAVKDDPRLGQLMDIVKGLRDRIDGYERAAGESNVAQSIAQIEAMTKELDIPVTRAVENGHELVLRTAHELWVTGGRAGKVADFVPDAAARAEAFFREKRPALAALADKAKGAKDPKEADDRGKDAGAPSIGRRAAARPDANTKSVWSGRNPMTDRNEVDAQIKAELGIKDKDPDEE